MPLIVFPVGGSGGGGTATFAEDDFTPLNGQTVFALSSPMIVGGLSIVTVNGVVYTKGVDYTIAGVVLTWLNALFALANTDSLVARYQVY